MSSETRRTTIADRDALEAVARYRTEREQGHWRRLLLAGANLRETDLSGLNLDECDLSGAVLDGARFAGSSLVRSSLAGASLLGADFSFAVLDKADLEGVDAVAATFADASLRRADLTNSCLNRADFSGADLTRANLHRSDLTSASFRGALAAQANFQGATLEDAVLTGVRGEPLFDPLEPSPTAGLGWPAARLAGPQLAELAAFYLTAHGWAVEQSVQRDMGGADLIVQRNNATAVIQVKATASPSSQAFSHFVSRFKRDTEARPNARLVVVLPGPVSQRIHDLAKANQISVLLVWVDSSGMRVEEITGTSGDPLRASA